MYNHIFISNIFVMAGNQCYGDPCPDRAFCIAYLDGSGYECMCRQDTVSGGCNQSKLSNNYNDQIIIMFPDIIIELINPSACLYNTS